MGNRSLLLLAVGAVMLVFAFGVSPAHDSNAQVVNGCTAVFDFTGTAKNFTVPSGITEVELNVFGAAGGDATGSAANVSEGGFGAGVQNAVLPVAPGDVLTVIVGGEGGPAESLLGTNPGGTGGFGYNGTAAGGQSGGTGGTAQDYHGGGGGGGASAVLLNGTLVVAAGGGGGGSHGGAGGDGGTVGGDGKKGSSGTGDPAAFGLGASQTAGGAGGVGSFGGLNGQAGVAGRGGDGGEAVGTHGGPSSPGGDAGGGGGGGTFGGGGAGGSAASNPGGGAGGGGGSSKTTIGTIQPGVRDGDGQIDVGLNNAECPGELQIEKSVGDATPKIGDRITYTLKVTNNGPANPDTDIVVTDSLPAEVKYVSDNCNGTNRPPWTWAVGSLADGASKTCKITVEVEEPGTDIPNTATVTGHNLDRKPSNNDSTVTITVPPHKYDLEIVKAVAPTQVLVGDQVKYTLTVTNLGPEESEPGGVADLLPTEVAYVSDTCGGSLHDINPPPLGLPTGGTIDLPEGTYWVTRIPALRPLDAVTCQITVRVLQPGDAITNYAGVLSHGTEVGHKLQNNLDDATIKAVASVPPGTPSSDLSIKKTAPPTVGQGARFTWTMTVTNNGPQPSTGSTVTDQIPAAVVHPTTSTHGCTVANRKLECALGPLGVGQSTRILLTGRAPLRTGCVTNSAGVSGNELDPHASNNTALAPTCTSAPRLQLTKSTASKVVRPSELLSYRIVVRNVGQGTALVVRVCDQPSADLEIIRAPGAVQVTKHRACWVIPRLAAGNQRTLPVIAQVVAGATPGVKPNTATATASNAKGTKRSKASVRVQRPTVACSARAVPRTRAHADPIAVPAC